MERGVREEPGGDLLEEGGQGLGFLPAPQEILPGFPKGFEIFLLVGPLQIREAVEDESLGPSDGLIENQAPLLLQGRHQETMVDLWILAGLVDAVGEDLGNGPAGLAGAFHRIHGLHAPLLVGRGLPHDGIGIHAHHILGGGEEGGLGVVAKHSPGGMAGI